MVNLHAAGGLLFEMTRGLYELFGTFQVKVSFRAHSADDATAAYCDIAVLVRQKDRGTDAVVSSAGGVCAIDTCQDRYSEFLELGVTEEGRATTASIRIDFLLFSEFHSGAIDQPHQRHSQSLGYVGDTENILGLSRHPGPCDYLVVEADHHSPFPVDLRQTVDDSGGPFLVFLGIEQGVQGTPSSRIDESLQSLPYGPVALER